MMYLILRHENVWRNGSKASPIPNLGAGWEGVVSLTLLLLHP
jgi:hypothetical protein